MPDREKIIKALECCTKKPCMLRELPAVDAVPVVHGEWKWSHGGQCSECGFHNSNFDYNYCPNCGAKMDGEADERGEATKG